ncbi:MAG: response regulator transcription factor [Actinomycetota bacterium]|nr:response regulator transcription factor [Actinomycetota bacterium]
MTDDAIRLAIVDDHEIVRLGIYRAMEGEEQVCLVGEAKTGEEALALARREKPQVMLVDVKLPDISGIEVVQNLKNDPETAEVQAIILTVYDDLEIATEAIRAGAIGYILKDCGKEQLLEAIKSAKKGVPLVSSSISRKIRDVLQYNPNAQQVTLVEKGALHSLTDREYDVIRLVTKGYSNKAMARDLCITVSTVKTHLRNIYRKLEVEDRAQAIIKAIKEGII